MRTKKCKSCLLCSLVNSCIHNIGWSSFWNCNQNFPHIEERGLAIFTILQVCHCIHLAWVYSNCSSNIAHCIFREFQKSMVTKITMQQGKKYVILTSFKLFFTGLAMYPKYGASMSSSLC